MSGLVVDCKDLEGGVCPGGVVLAAFNSGVGEAAPDIVFTGQGLDLVGQPGAVQVHSSFAQSEFHVLTVGPNVGGQQGGVACSFKIIY